MKVLVVGGGGREHAIVHTLKKSSHIDTLYCAPGNSGISQIANCVDIKATDIDKMVDFVKTNSIDFVVVAPDDPLALGMVDAFESIGIPAFGPRKNAAIIEASKVFSKSLMAKYNIPTAKYSVFDDMDKALEYVRRESAPIVVKADGLALGKGVVVAQTVEEAENAIINIMQNRAFGDSGLNIVIEECMTGPEVTVLCFTDGKTLYPMPSSQDHKRAYDNDKGANTGGMGAFSPSRYYTKDIADECMNRIFLPTINALNAEGRTFKGVLYFGLMLTPNGPKVVEYNARFGDPEAQAVLSLLDTDLFEIMQAVVKENLSSVNINWKNGASCCIVTASGGYPEKYSTGYPISGLDNMPENVTVFHAGTKSVDGQTVTSGGRVLGITAIGGTLDSAIELAYSAVGNIHFRDMHYRKDIGKK